jgi:PAS domain S-box-containing protein
VVTEPGAIPSGKPVQGPPEKYFLKQLTIALGLLVVLTAVLGIAGMYFRITLLSSVYPGYKTMALSAALVWIFLGSVLVINSVTSHRRRSGLVLMTILAAIALMEAIEILFNLQGSHFIFETWFVQSGMVLFGQSASYVSPVAAGLITAAAVAMFFLVKGSSMEPENNHTEDAIAIAGIFISLVSLTFFLSYVYGDPLLYGTQFIPIAAVSALAAFFTGSGLVAAAGPSAIPVRYVTGDSTRSRLLRTFIALTVIIILCENVLFSEISSLYAVSHALLLSASLVLFIFVTTLVVAQISGKLGRSLDGAEQALIDNEKRLREAYNLLESVTEGAQVIIAAEDTNFRYTYFNKKYVAEIFRLTGREIVIGMNMIDLFTDQPKEQRSELDEWSKVLQGESVNKLIGFGNQATGRKIYNVLHVPIRDEKGTITGAGEVAYDVTKQVQVEDKLRETKEYLDNLITYANAPIIVWDPQFRITLFNHAFEHLTGRKAKEVIGKQLDILLPDSYMTVAMDLIRKTIDGERWDSVEIPILHKKGGIRTVLWNSAAIFGPDGKTIVSTIAQGQDITDRKKIESEYRLRVAEYAKMNIALEEEIRQRKVSDATLNKTLSLLNASLESTADGIFVVDQQGRITSYNQNFINMWNIPRVLLVSGENETVMNHVLSQLKNPEGFLASIQELHAHPARESFDMIEFNDGKIFERYSKPQKIGDSVVGRVWSFRDITDRKHAEEKLVASIQEKEVLLREIHHRVKNNLQLISGLLDMTRMRTVDESTNSILTDMMLKIQTMAQIHTRLYESKQFGKISIKGQFRDQVTALSDIYSHKGHEISCEIHSQEVFLPVDQAIPCALVVNEILSNAYKHAFKGRKQGTIEISAVQENGQIHIIVRDDGIGMPAHFDISRSNSLGLKLIRTLVQHQLKGSLMINSHHGTEIIIEFPIMIAGT